MVPINIPPLRQRREDIIPLIQHFLEYYNKNQGKSVSLSKDLVRKLISYNWPGNVRELKNTLERIVVLAEGNLAEDIDFFENGNDLMYDIDNQEDIIIRNIMPIKSAYNIVDNILVKMVYSETKSIVKTARKLGIDPSTIHRKINMGEIQL